MNLFTLDDGRNSFYQWDSGRMLIVHDDVCGEVHFCNGSSDCSLRREIIDLEGKRVVKVPDILLQDSRSITVFAYVKDKNGGYTRRAIAFPVRTRTRPDDYVYTEEELKTWEQLEERVEGLEKDLENKAAAAVQDYIAKNPDAISGLPKITEVSEGKYLQVKNGVAVWGDLEIPQQYGLITYDQNRTITIT